MRKVSPRPLTTRELAVVRRLLVLGGNLEAQPNLDELQVVGRCECGCATIDFAEDTEGSSPLVDVFGRTADGADVGVILWARHGFLSGLEIYTLATDTPQLPTPESLTL